MGRVTLESALGRRSVRTVLAAGCVSATLLLLAWAPVVRPRWQRSNLPNRVHGRKNAP
jgi:hypothetical protein